MIYLYIMNYPRELDPIFNTLAKKHIRPVIVGGFVRDALLGIESKDIDIELYGITSLESLEEILAEFGEINSVGKSFGVCKLTFEGLEIDFSLPREDSKVSHGHRGFEITTNTSLSFKEAASRRDFTMNAIGFDIITSKLLDPFEGTKDIAHQLIRAVDLKKFGEDPLRVLRAVQFASRFAFRLDDALFLECKRMIQNEVLEELAKERIFEEIKKLLLKSKYPSIGLKLLKKLDGFTYFKEFASLDAEEFEEILKSIDYLASQNISLKKLTLMLALLTAKFSTKERKDFLDRLTNKKELLSEVEIITSTFIDVNNFSDFDIYLLATKVEIKTYIYYLKALMPKENTERLEKLEKRAKELHVYEKKAPPLLLGRDLIALGITPSAEFSKILREAYLAQISSKFQTKKEAIEWVKNNLL